MNIVKICILMLSLFVSTANAYQNLKVVVVFDQTSIGYKSSSYRYYKAAEIYRKLKKSFSNSELNSYVRFYLGAWPQSIISTNSETIIDVKNRYASFHSLNSNGTKTPKNNLQDIQKANKADILIVVMDKYFGIFSPNTCGSAITIPSSTQELRNGDNAIVFLNIDNHGCSIKKEIVAHEVGHSFGLHHGYVVALESGDWGNYGSGSNCIMVGCNGFGELNYLQYAQYGTIMADFDPDLDQDEINNRFSDKTKTKCDTTLNKICGDGTSNAVAIIKNYSWYFNNRGSWYTYG